MVIGGKIKVDGIGTFSGLTYRLEILEIPHDHFNFFLHQRGCSFYIPTHCLHTEAFLDQTPDNRSPQHSGRL